MLICQLCLSELSWDRNDWLPGVLSLTRHIPVLLQVGRGTCFEIWNVNKAHFIHKNNEWWFLPDSIWGDPDSKLPHLPVVHQTSSLSLNQEQTPVCILLFQWRSDCGSLSPEASSADTPTAFKVTVSLWKYWWHVIRSVAPIHVDGHSGSLFSGEFLTQSDSTTDILLSLQLTCCHQ